HRGGGRGGGGHAAQRRRGDRGAVGRVAVRPDRFRADRLARGGDRGRLVIACRILEVRAPLDAFLVLRREGIIRVSDQRRSVAPAADQLGRDIGRAHVVGR